MARTLMLLTVAAACIAPLERPVSAAARDWQVSYADVMRMPPEQRKQAFGALPPENRAAIMHQHLERWLDVHRPDLSSNAQALVRAAINMVTPELYAAPPNAALQDQQSRLSHQLACALGEDRAATLMNLDSPPQRLERSWSQSARLWVDWLVNCAGR